MNPFIWTNHLNHLLFYLFYMERIVRNVYILWLKMESFNFLCFFFTSTHIHFDEFEIHFYGLYEFYWNVFCQIDLRVFTHFYHTVFPIQHANNKKFGGIKKSSFACGILFDLNIFDQCIVTSLNKSACNYVWHQNVINLLK